MAEFFLIMCALGESVEQTKTFQLDIGINEREREI